MFYGFKVFDLWVSLRGHGKSRLQLLDEGFYDAFLLRMREEGHIKPVKHERCPQCGSARMPLVLEWQGGPPRLLVRSLGQTNAARVAEIAKSHIVRIRRKGEGYQILVDETPLRGMYLTFPKGSTVEKIQTTVGDW